jgi:cytochrome c oxidase subunit IV
MVEEVNVERMDEEAQAGRRAAYRRGIGVLIALAVLTALEFLVASVLNASPVLLFVMILAKAGLILQYYMHMDSVWSEGEAH